MVDYALPTTTVVVVHVHCWLAAPVSFIVFFLALTALPSNPAQQSTAPASSAFVVGRLQPGNVASQFHFSFFANCGIVIWVKNLENLILKNWVIVLLLWLYG